MLRSREDVWTALRELPQDSLIVLHAVSPQIISMQTVSGRYTLNMNYADMDGLDLSQCRCRFLVLDSYGQGALLKRLGISRAAESVRLQERVLSRPEQWFHALSTDELLFAFTENQKKLEQRQLINSYNLMRRAQPYLSDLPGFHVDRKRYEAVLHFWGSQENMRGTVTAWREQLRLHPDIMPVNLIPNGMLHGRFTAKNPSILAMPAELRSAMNAPHGYTFVSVDFHQCQPRIIAEASQDPVFRAPFVNGTDYYTMWASFLLNKKEQDVIPEERKACKAIALKWCFGMGDDKLSDEFELQGFSKELALQGMRRFENACDRLKSWEQYLISRTCKQKGIWTISAVPSLRRFFPVPHGSFHNAMNYLATGTEVTIMLVAIIALGKKLEEKYPAARIALYLYDELIVQCPREEADAVAALTQDALLWAFRKILPDAPTSGLLDCRIAPNWGALKG